MKPDTKNFGCGARKLLPARKLWKKIHWLRRRRGQIIRITQIFSNFFLLFCKVWWPCSCTRSRKGWTSSAEWEVYSQTKILLMPSTCQRYLFVNIELYFNCFQLIIALLNWHRFGWICSVSFAPNDHGFSFQIFVWKHLMFTYLLWIDGWMASRWFNCHNCHLNRHLASPIGLPTGVGLGSRANLCSESICLVFFQKFESMLHCSKDLSFVGLLGVGGFSKVELWQHMALALAFLLGSIQKSSLPSRSVVPPMPWRALTKAQLLQYHTSRFVGIVRIPFDIGNCNADYIFLAAVDLGLLFSPASAGLIMHYAMEDKRNAEVFVTM